MRRLAFGSDWFVAPPTPLEGIYAAVTRRTLDDAQPGRLGARSRRSASKKRCAHTRRGGAYASFDESRKGVLAAGKLADLVMLDRDMFAIAPEEIRNARVALTIVGGKIVHQH